MTYRLSKRLNITLPPQLHDRLATYKAEYGVKPAVIIQQALWDWFAKQGPLEAKSTTDSALVLDAAGRPLVGGQLYQVDSVITDYWQAGGSTEEQLQIIEQFEAAQRHQYTSG